MRRVLTLALLLPLVFGSGCFVLDEIDAGMEIMDAHSPERNQQKQGQQAAAGDGEKPPTYDQVRSEWWKDANTLSLSPDEKAAQEDPLVPCQHAGKSVYTKRSDCLARGGQPG
ncbi:MAG: hypothetical protein ACQGVC_07485 [Myxococcota bacterium]